MAAPLARILDALERLYGSPRPGEPRDPFELVLWENVAYLTTDERRQAAFDALRRQVGTTPEVILAAPAERLRAVASGGGILADRCAAKLHRAAAIALRDFGGDLGSLRQMPAAAALRALGKFPGIGEPGAEKILLFSGIQPIFALESNGLRALLRLGFGKEDKTYAGSYRSVREATRRQVVEDCEWLIRAHHLLRRHGQELCRRAGPRCGACPLTSSCAYYRSNA